MIQINDKTHRTTAFQERHLISFAVDWVRAQGDAEGFPGVGY